MKQFTHSLPRFATVAAMVLIVAGSLQGAGPTAPTMIIDDGQMWRYMHLSDANTNDITLDPYNNLDFLPFDDVWFERNYAEPDLRFDDGDGNILTFSWEEGPGGLQYGNVTDVPTPPGTALTPAPSANERYSAYFRTNFRLTTSQITGPPLLVDYVFDDGATVYIDGNEVARVNCCQDVGNQTIPDGLPPTFLDRSLAGGQETYANATSTGVEVLWSDFSSGGTLSPTTHTLAVSVHNSGNNSSDLGLGFKLYQPGNGRSWNVNAAGDWADPANWDLGVPNGQNEFAIFDDAINQDRTVWTDASNLSLDGVQFDDNNTYNIAGTGTVTLRGNNRDASLNVFDGDHVFQTRLELGRNTDAEITTGNSITFFNELDLGGRTLRKSGGGELRVRDKTDAGGSGTIQVQEGMLAGSGLVMGNVTANGGDVAPGGRAGADAHTLSIKNNATIQSGSAVELNLFGAGENDAVSGAGSGNLNFQSGSTIDVSLKSGYRPADGAEFALFEQWGNIVDSGATLNLPNGYEWDSSELFSSGILRVGDPPAGCDFTGDSLCNVDDANMLTTDIVAGRKTQADLQTWLAEAATKNGLSEPYNVGDANLDGKVDAQDLNALGQNWQAASTLWGNGDFTADGQVNAQDLNLVGQNWQTAISAPAAATVPEPSSLALLAVAGLGLLARRRR